MDNLKTFFKNGNSCANAYFLRLNAKTEVNYIPSSLNAYLAKIPEIAGAEF